MRFSANIFVSSSQDFFISVSLLCCGSGGDAEVGKDGTVPNTIREGTIPSGPIVSFIYLTAQRRSVSGSRLGWFPEQRKYAAERAVVGFAGTYFVVRCPT